MNCWAGSEGLTLLTTEYQNLVSQGAPGESKTNFHSAYSIHDRREECSSKKSRVD